MEKKVLYIDMDNVLVDFESGINKLDETLRQEHDGNYDEAPGIFSLMQPMPNAIASFLKLSQYFDTYILSTAPWNNQTAWSDKLNWVKDHIGDKAHKRLILSHHKHLNIGDYLIDDRTKNGADKFKGELILFGSESFPDWNSVTNYLLNSI